MEPAAGDPHRPDDHVDAAAASENGSGGPPVQPKLDAVGYLRFFWRQLTSMRTALVLLLLLALAAVPGSLVPQRSSDPNGVIQYREQYPELYPILDGLGLFSTFTSPWFSAIYLLLFISLVGCIVPRTKHHLDALRARPPRTPVRLGRLVGHTTAETPVDPDAAVEAAHRVLRRQGYRVERYTPADSGQRGPSVSAERGYLRETGNLVFHTGLVGVLVAVALGGGFGYTGQEILVQGSAFTNTGASYDSFEGGRFVDEDRLDPYALRLDDFTAEYQLDVMSATWQPLDFEAELSTREQGGDWRPGSVKINEPLSIGGTQVYLLGNGYAPVLTIRDAEGEVVAEEVVPFRPQDDNLFSIGVLKIPDGLDAQVGMLGLFAPDAAASEGVLHSVSPHPTDPLLQFEVFRGDLGLDEGAPVNVYTLDTDGLEKLAGRDAPAEALQLAPGDEVALPDGLGTVEFSELRRFVSLEIHHDPTQGWVLFFAIATLGGLLVSLFIPRRRVWVRATPEGDRTVLEYAGLARGEDPGLATAVGDLARRHAEELGSARRDGLG